MAPTLAHCVSLAAPQGGAARLQAAGRQAGMDAPVAHGVSLAARLTLGILAARGCTYRASTAAVRP